MLELLHQGCAPAALVFSHAEMLVTLGVWFARAMFEKSIPVVVLDPATHEVLGGKEEVAITDSGLQTADGSLEVLLSPISNATVLDFALD